MKMKLLALTFAGLAALPAAAQDTTAGERLYNQRCATCHGTAERAAAGGPSLVGVLGRTAGTVEDYNYSSALRDSGLTWDETNLDSFLTNPAALVRGTRMAMRVTRPADRTALIGYLETLR